MRRPLDNKDIAAKILRNFRHTNTIAHWGIINKVALGYLIDSGLVCYIDEVNLAITPLGIKMLECYKACNK